MSSPVNSSNAYAQAAGGGHDALCHQTEEKLCDTANITIVVARVKPAPWCDRRPQGGSRRAEWRDPVMVDCFVWLSKIMPYRLGHSH